MGLIRSVYGKEKREPNDAWHLYFTLNYHFDDVDLNGRVNALPLVVGRIQLCLGTRAEGHSDPIRSLLGNDHCYSA